MYGEREINRIAQLDLLRNLDLLEAADGVIVDALIRAVVNHQVCSVQHACAVAEAEPAIHHVRNLMLIKPVASSPSKYIQSAAFLPSSTQYQSKLPVGSPSPKVLLCGLLQVSVYE